MLTAASAVAAEDWLELTTPHFKVLSEASESRTRDWAVEFELFRRAMTLVMPVNERGIEPVTLVLFRSDRRLRSFKPLEKGKAAKIAGYFARPPGHNLIAISIEGARDDVREIIYHEAVHWHLAASGRPRPLWMEEGLAQVFGNFRLNGSTFVVGALRPESMRYVKVAKPMPFTEMMHVGTMAYNGKHADVAARFYHQAWVTVHELVFGTNGIGPEAVGEFLRGTATDRDSMRDFEQGLKLTAADMDARMANYLARGQFKPLTLPFDRSTVQEGFSLKPASAGETDLNLGLLLVGAGRAPDAEPYLWRAHGALAGDGRVLEALGAMYLAQERERDAVDKYRDALRAGRKSHIGHYLLGREALRESSTLRFGEPDLTDVVDHFVKAVRINERFEPAYESIAWCAPYVKDRASEIEALLDEALHRFPANAKLREGVEAVARARRARARPGSGSLLSPPQPQP